MKRKKDLLLDIVELKRQVQQLKGNDINISEFDDDVIRFGALADTHLGSLYTNQDALNFAYKFFEREGIQVVFHAGDLVDGEKMYRGQEYEISHHGADAQVNLVVSDYPNNITTKFICGNHCASFWKRSGIDIGKQIAGRRDDMLYLGFDEADIVVKNKKEQTASVRLIHPRNGTAYALSYNGQKYIESLSGGNKPNIVISGHYHKAELIPNYRNVAYFQAGTLQKQTPFMRGRNLSAMMGVWIIELWLNDDGLIRVKAEFVPIY